MPPSVQTADSEVTGEKLAGTSALQSGSPQSTGSQRSTGSQPSPASPDLKQAGGGNPLSPSQTGDHPQTLANNNNSDAVNSTGTPSAPPSQTNGQGGAPPVGEQPQQPGAATNDPAQAPQPGQPPATDQGGGESDDPDHPDHPDHPDKRKDRYPGGTNPADNPFIKALENAAFQPHPKPPEKGKGPLAPQQAQQPPGGGQPPGAGGGASPQRQPPTPSAGNPYGEAGGPGSQANGSYPNGRGGAGQSGNGLGGPGKELDPHQVKAPEKPTPSEALKILKDLSDLFPAAENAENGWPGFKRVDRGNLDSDVAGLGAAIQALEDRDRDMQQSWQKMTSHEGKAIANWNEFNDAYHYAKTKTKESYSDFAEKYQQTNGSNDDKEQNPELLQAAHDDLDTAITSINRLSQEMMKDQYSFRTLSNRFMS